MHQLRMDFPGGTKVRARLPGFTIETDQPVRAGGDGSAPSPYDHFLASIGTCAGFYLLSFLIQRDIPTDGVRLTLESEKSPERKTLARVTLRLALPEGFPDKYRGAVVRAMDRCSVKQSILNPPTFETIVESERFEEVRSA